MSQQQHGKAEQSLRHVTTEIAEQADRGTDPSRIERARNATAEWAADRLNGRMEYANGVILMTSSGPQSNWESYIDDADMDEPAAVLDAMAESAIVSDVLDRMA